MPGDRLRLATAIDLSKARDHKRCNGTGVCGYKEIDDPENPGGKVKVPIICRCISRRGGVKKDAFDKMTAELAQQVASGHFAENLAGDVRRLPAEAMIVKIDELKKTVADDKTDPAVRSQISKALEILEQEA